MKVLPQNFKNSVQSMAEKINYPEPLVFSDDGAVKLNIDDSEVVLSMSSSGKLRFFSRLVTLPENRDERREMLEKILKLSFPRALKDNVVLCYSDDGDALELWQDVSLLDDISEMVGSLNAFLLSRDWWQESLDSFKQEELRLHDAQAAPQFMFFRP